MSEATKCDRCKDYYDKPNDATKHSSIGFMDYQGNIDVIYDLCPACQKEITEVLLENPYEEEPDELEQGETTPDPPEQSENQAIKVARIDKESRSMNRNIRKWTPEILQFIHEYFQKHPKATNDSAYQATKARFELTIEPYTFTGWIYNYSLKTDNPYIPDVKYPGFDEDE